MNRIEAKIVIVDYGIGNLFSVKKACENVGVSAIVTSKKEDIRNADGLILPGVGAFGKAMESLNENGLTDSLREFAASGKYMMGVCLGMQLLMTESEEFGIQKGLNIIEGRCIRFPSVTSNGKTIRVPQITWNSILSPKRDHSFDRDTPLKNLKSGEYMYFVHSYYVLPKENDNILSLTNYEGVEYCSAVRKNNIFAFQFHPEKSGAKGVSIYKNFFSLID